MVNPLQPVLEVSLQFAQERNLEKLLRLVTQKAVEIASAERGCIVLRKGDELLVPTVAVGMRPEEGERISSTIAQEVLQSCRPKMWEDLSADHAVRGAHSILQQRLRSAMCAPLMVGGKVLGILYVDATAQTQYGQADLTVFQALASQAAMAIENARLFQAVITDSLTGLYSGGLFFHRLKEEVERHRRYRRPLSLIMADLNNLKGINDSYGHLVGSRALVTMGRILRQHVRSSDVPCRYGGDEFAIILPETERAAAESLRKRLEGACQEVSTDELPGWMGSSFGAATCPEDGDTSTALIAQADARMYENKRALYASLGVKR